jgi:hypothetical protein
LVVGIVGRRWRLGKVILVKGLGWRLEVEIGDLVSDSK